MALSWKGGKAMNSLATLPPPEQRLTRHEAAAALGVCARTLGNYERVGYKGIRLKPYRVGGKLWYSKELLETWVLETERARQAQNEAIGAGGEREHQAALERLRQMGVDV
jgi:hypothetical protein